MLNIYISTWREVLILLIVIETVSYLSGWTVYHIQETWDLSLGTESGCNDVFFFFWSFPMQMLGHTHLHIFLNS